MAIIRKNNTPTLGRQDTDWDTLPSVKGLEPVSRGITHLMDELESNILKLHEMTGILESNLETVLTCPGPQETKEIGYTGDSTLGAKLCNFNYETELLLDRLSDICSRINL